MTQEKLSSILTEKFFYSKYSAAETAADLMGMEPSVWEKFAQYLLDNQLPQNWDINGYSLQMLIARYGFKPPAAFLVMSGLCTDYDNTVELLKMAVM